MISENKLKHSLGVANMCQKIAAVAGLNKEQQILDCLNTAEEYEMPDEYPDLKKICEIHLYVDESHKKIISDGEEIVLTGYESTAGYLYNISGDEKTYISPELDKLIDQYIAENNAG